MDQQDLAGKPGRRRNDLQKVKKFVLFLVLLSLGRAAIMHIILILEPDGRIGAVPQHRCLTPLH